MKTKFALSAAIIFALASGLSAATRLADFSGTWTLDKARSEGLPPDMNQVMTIVQTGDTLKLETKLTTAQGEQIVPDSYTLNGAETPFTPRTGDGTEGKGKRTAKWTADKSGIEVIEQATFDTPEGAVTIEMHRKWMMAADGKTLTIELHHKSPQGEKRSKRTFVKT